MSGNERINTKEKLIKVKEKTAAMQAELFLNIQRFATKQPKVFAKMFFEALIKKGNISENPFASLFKIGTDINGEEFDVYKRSWGDLADIVLNKIDGIKEVRKEYVPLTQMIKNNFYFSEFLYSEIISGATNIEEMKYQFLKRLEDDLASSTIFPCELINQGMPLYKQNDLEEFSKVSDFDNDFIYIFMKGHYSELSSSGRYPEWAKKYFFKSEHLVTHGQFFDGFEGDEKSLLVRRRAFRTHIGEKDVSVNFAIDSKAIPQNQHESRLMGILAKVIDRYYGSQFDVNDRDTWPKQVAVVEWLKSKFNLTEREAISIDIVSRPDLARGK